MTFSVKVGDYETLKYKITCEVPQGAVLSPTLFSIFINDIPSRYDNKRGRHTLLYADDLIFLATFGKTTKMVEKDANKYLDELEKWSGLWRLKFVPQKCSYTVFSRYKKSNATKVNLRLYDTRINEDKKPKFLGLVFDGRLTGKNHLEKIKKTCCSRLNIIKLLTHKSWGLKKSTLVQIYKSLIRSIIEYTGLIYYGFCPEQRRELEVIQNSALTVIFNKKREDGTKNLLKLAGIESIKARICKLNKAYLRRSIRTENPLIVDLIEN